MWAGGSYETGGEIVVGLNRAEGCIFNLVDPDDAMRFIRFETESTSIGIGLGGSAALNFVLGLNIDTATDVDGIDAGFDFAIDLALGGTSRYIRSMPDYLKFFYQFQKGLKGHLFQAGRALEVMDNFGKLKSTAENIYRNMDAIKSAKAGKPALISIPLSTGLRLSANYKFAVTDVIGSGVLKLV